MVDVQPAYCTMFDDNEDPKFSKIIKFVNNQVGPILMYVNAEDQGLSDDTIDSIKEFWEDRGFDPNKWTNIKIVDKGYGYFRSWMDYGISDSNIIKTIRLMYQSKVSDSRELFGGENSDIYKQGFRKLLGNNFDEYIITDQLFINWTNVAQLKQFSGAYIMGGGRNECLREVELLMNAFNIKYKRINDLIILIH